MPRICIYLFKNYCFAQSLAKCFLKYIFPLKFFGHTNVFKINPGFANIGVGAGKLPVATLMMRHWGSRSSHSRRAAVNTQSQAFSYSESSFYIRFYFNSERKKSPRFARKVLIRKL
jgi:hypothetical protein